MHHEAIVVFVLPTQRQVSTRNFRKQYKKEGNKICPCSLPGYLVTKLPLVSTPRRQSVRCLRYQPGYTVVGRWKLFTLYILSKSGCPVSRLPLHSSFLFILRFLFPILNLTNPLFFNFISCPNSIILNYGEMINTSLCQPQFPPGSHNHEAAWLMPHTGWSSCTFFQIILVRTRFKTRKEVWIFLLLGYFA